MREIELDAPASKLPVFSVMLYGPTRTGKTHFAATWPRPYIYADVAESGYKTITTMDRSTWFEPDVKPIVVGIDKMNDIAADRERLKRMIDAGLVLTVVHDAFSFYCDFFLAQLQKLNPTKDNRQVYGDLGKHLREVRQSFGVLGTNTIWNCLESPPSTDDPVGKPLIPGKEAGKFAAGVDFLWHTRIEQKRQEGKIVEEIHERRTRSHHGFLCGHRLGAQADLLPDPFVGSYSDLLAYLEYDVELLRASLKQYDAAKAKQLMSTAAAAPVAPPVAKPVIKGPTTSAIKPAPQQQRVVVQARPVQSVTPSRAPAPLASKKPGP